MANKKTIETTNDIETKRNLIEIIQDIDFRLTHLEDIEMDNRKFMAKLVKQGNTIVKFLKQFEIEEVIPEDLEIGMGLPPLPDYEDRMERTVAIKALIDDIIDRHADLTEFEKELEKHRDKITPGQAGEA